LVSGNIIRFKLYKDATQVERENGKGKVFQVRSNRGRFIFWAPGQNGDKANTYLQCKGGISHLGMFKEFETGVLGVQDAKSKKPRI